MAPVIIGTASQPRTIVISPDLFSGDENRKIVDTGELPKYAVGLFESNGPGPRKRKRLTHLTPEEKIMRRKLKNRVAAQTARDRKKARLETLEDAVTKIHEQARKLLDVNAQLLERTEELERENQLLRERLGLNTAQSFIKEKRKELSVIKEEFNNIETYRSCDSSDEESHCVLTSCGGNDVVKNMGSSMNVSTQEASKCVSPEPAAGSCQSSEADPLASRKRRNVLATSSINNNTIEPTEDDTDITSLLKALEAIDPEQCHITNFSEEGHATGPPETLTKVVSATKIQVPLNIFDHEYTKLAPCVLYNQTVSSESSILMESPEDSKKLTALFEEPEKRMQELELQVKPEPLDTIASFTADTLVDNGLQSEDIDAVLDSLICNSSNVKDQSDSESVGSGATSCDSPLSCLLDTPSPLSDTMDPFDCSSDDCGFLDGPFDLFPQLAVM